MKNEITRDRLKAIMLENVSVLSNYTENSQQWSCIMKYKLEKWRGLCMFPIWTAKIVEMQATEINIEETLNFIFSKA